ALTEPKLEDTLVAIHARAPHARVLLVGYPRIAPASETCPDVLPFADGDYAYLTSVERALNGALAKAAANAGAVYVDTFGPSAGHDACGSGGIPWVNGRHFRPLAAAPYHPNAAGMAGVASILVDALVGREPDLARAELAGRTAAFETRIMASYEPGAPAGLATRSDTARLARGYGER
ncbi:MAG: GDSL-type esterase/lipase family protein, partial [Nocardioidaceae bacterium]